MTNKYTYGESYFLHASEELLNSKLPDSICEAYGLPLGTLLKDAVWHVYELEDNSKVITLQLNVGEYSELNDVSDYISETDFNNALAFYKNYGITEFLTMAEFKKLPFKEDEY